MRLEDDEEHAYRSRDSVKLEAVVHSRGYETALVGISGGDPRIPRRIVPHFTLCTGRDV